MGVTSQDIKCQRGKLFKVGGRALPCSLRILQGAGTPCALCNAGKPGVQAMLWVSFGHAKRVG